MEMTTEKPDRKKHTYVQSLAAPPEKVFPLLCPTLEKEWVPGWAPMKIITGSGFAEKDCIFVTPAEPNPSIWIVTRHDPAGFALEMYKITPGHTVGKIEISLQPDGTGTGASVSYEYTALSREGQDFLAGFTSEWYVGFMKGWERSLNHYLMTGRKRGD
jgi:hypothetical protein